MTSFDFNLPTKIVFGPGRVQELGQLAKEITDGRVLVVSDPGIVAVGHSQLGIDALTSAGLEVLLFDGVQENPTTEHVAAGVVVAKDFQPNLIVGLGGGSSMDCAKGINFIHSCGGQMSDYWGTGKATGPLLPMIAIPTTAGTGSETQSYALISDAQTHVKMACGDKRAAFQTALLDPELTLTQPVRLTALTGIDAIAHSLETYVTKRRNWISQWFSKEAFRRLATNFATVLDEPDNLSARSEMQFGACLAGLAIENSMLGAAHALANPLTAEYGIAHGEAIALMLPHVVRRNGLVVGDWYHDLIASVANEDNVTSSVPMPTIERGPEGLANFLSKVSSHAGLLGKLGDCGVEADRLPKLAAAATQQWTGTFNPVEFSRDDFLELYQTAL